MEYGSELVHIKQLCSAVVAQTRQARKEKAKKEKTLEIARSIFNESKLSKALSDLLIDRANVYSGNNVEVSWNIQDFSVCLT